MTFRFDVKGQTGEIPQLGMGTSGITGEQCTKAVATAIQCGYRMVDTALLYENQEAVGAGVRASGVPREDIWVTSKVSFFPPSSEGVWMYNSNNIKGQEAASIDLCLQQLGLEQVDLMLIHNPCCSVSEFNASCLPHFFELFRHFGKEDAVRPEILPNGVPLRPLAISASVEAHRRSEDPVAARATRKLCWEALERAKREGKVRFIGVANYTAELLTEMKEYADIMPCVNQLELHPRFASPGLQRVAKDLGCVLTGYGTLISTQIGKELQTGKVLGGIAQRLGRTPLEVALRWTLQKGVVGIPRSGSKVHLEQNLAVMKGGEPGGFVLSDEDMAAIDGLNEDHPYYWTPEPVGPPQKKQRQ